MGRIPWSAGVPLDPPFRPKNQTPAEPERPATGLATDGGVCPTDLYRRPVFGKARGAAYPPLRCAVLAKYNPTARSMLARVSRTGRPSYSLIAFTSR